MDRFINQINQSAPLTVRELRSYQGDSLQEALGRIEFLQLSSYMDETYDNLQLFHSLRHLELFQFTEDELKRLLNHLKEVTLMYRENDADWGIEGLVVKDCQASNEISSLLCDLFLNHILKNLRIFHWMPRIKDKSGELGEKNWLKICDAIRNSSCISLQSLVLPNNHIHEKGCKALLHLFYDNYCKDLTCLDLEGNQIGNNSYAELFRSLYVSNILQQLEELNISDNNVNFRGMKACLQALKQCHFVNLKVLRIGRNHFHKKGLELFFHTLSYHTLPQLRTLDLSGLQLGEEGMVGLVQLLRENRIPYLEELSFHHCNLSERECEHLSYCIQDGYCSGLVKLDLSSNHLKWKSISIIRRMLCKQFLPHLSTLLLDDNQLGNKGIEELGNASDIDCLTQVKYLSLCHNHITDEGASCIYLYILNKQWKAVEELVLNDNTFSKISVIHLRSLVEMNNNLMCIYLNQMTKQRDPYLQYNSLPVEIINEEHNTEDEDEENTSYLHEIFGISSEMIIPPCFITRTSKEDEEEWSPFNASLTPNSESVGLGVDNDLYSNSTA